MVRRFLQTAFAALAISTMIAVPAWARAHATPTPAPTPTPVADPAITKLVRQQFVAWQAGSINKSLYVPQLQVKLTDDRIAQISKELGQLGALNDIVYIGPMVITDAPNGSRGFIYQMICSEGNVYLLLIVDGQGKIGSFLFKDRLDTETVKVPASPAPDASPR